MAYNYIYKYPSYMYILCLIFSFFHSYFNSTCQSLSYNLFFFFFFKSGGGSGGSWKNKKKTKNKNEKKKNLLVIASMIKESYSAGDSEQRLSKQEQAVPTLTHVNSQTSGWLRHVFFNTNYL